jgi:hypothetical protein
MALSAVPSNHSLGPADEGGRQVSMVEPAVSEGETKPPTAFKVGFGVSSVSNQRGHASRAWTQRSSKGPSSNRSACGASIPPAANVALFARSLLTTLTERPLLESSRAVASPLMPPPTTTTSSFFVDTRVCGARSAAAVVMRSAASMLARGGGRCAVPALAVPCARSSTAGTRLVVQACSSASKASASPCDRCTPALSCFSRGRASVLHDAR